MAGKSSDYSSDPKKENVDKLRVLRKIGNITLDVLEFISMNAEMCATAFDQDAFRENQRDSDWATLQIFDCIRGLRKRNLVEAVKENGKYSVVITRKGKIKLLENSTDDRKDGKWRMLSFDIPEQLRRKRDAFRRSIKRIGFRKLQKSLWVCPYIKADEVEEIISEYDLSKYVVYMVVEKTDCEEHLQKLFSDSIAD